MKDLALGKLTFARVNSGNRGNVLLLSATGKEMNDSVLCSSHLCS
jgi:hypothetical protein